MTNLSALAMNLFFSWEQEMEKTNGGEAITLSTEETGRENLGLELTVIHQFRFCTTLFVVACSCRVFGCSQSPLPSAGPYDWPKLYLCLQEEGINPEGTRRTEDQGHSLEDGLGPSTRQRYKCSGIGSVRKGLGWDKCGQWTQKKSSLPHSQGACGLIVEIRLMATWR